MEVFTFFIVKFFCQPRLQYQGYFVLGFKYLTEKLTS